jgi:type 1 glutamine amidotransferase
MRKINLKLVLLLCVAGLFSIERSPAQDTESHSKKIKVFVIGSMDKNHTPMVIKAMPMFQKMAEDNNFEIHFTRDTAELNFPNLSQYQVFIQLSIAYFDFSRPQQFAIQQFIKSGRGWIGIHGAGLTGKQFASKDGRDWKWYWHLLGDAYYIPHPPLQDGVVSIVDREHPVTKNLPTSFSLRDEWYEFENAPSNVHVLAVADESTYKPRKPMGYHPTIWTNPDYNRVLYISVGHDSTSCANESYKILLRDAIRWAADIESSPVNQQGQNQTVESEASVLTHQKNYNADLPKRAMFKSKFPVVPETSFNIVNAMTLDLVTTGKLDPAAQLNESKGYWYSPIRFNNFSKPGFYNIQVSVNNKVYTSPDFEISKSFRAKRTSSLTAPSSTQPKFNAIVLTERGGNHESFVTAALDWIKKYSEEENFEFIEINDPDTITKEFLNGYKLFIQLNYPPYMWTVESKTAFEDYIDNGKGAWIGFHHASLLGEFDGYPIWPWFSDFLGTIRFKNYVAKRADGEVHVENKRHPIFAKLPSHFNLPGEEWYTFDKNPREKVEVLATVDENSYKPATDVKMGDHPVVWTNPKKKAKNIYFLFGHHGGLFEVKEFKQLLGNSITWAVGKK